MDAVVPAGGESRGDVTGPSPPFPEHPLGFSELLKRAERAQAEVTEEVTHSLQCRFAIYLNLGLNLVLTLCSLLLILTLI